MALLVLSAVLVQCYRQWRNTTLQVHYRPGRQVLGGNTCEVGVSLHSKTHPLCMKCSRTQVHIVMHTCILACSLPFFYNPCMSPFNSKNISFTCFHAFFTSLQQILLSWILPKLCTVELSCKAMQCTRQYCSANLLALRSQGLFSDVGLEVRYVYYRARCT